MVSLPQDRRPPLPCDGAGQHGALANRYRGDAHFLVIGKVEQVHICSTGLQKKTRHIIQQTIIETIQVFVKLF